MPISESAGALQKSERHPVNAGLIKFNAIIDNMRQLTSEVVSCSGPRPIDFRRQGRKFW
jgi:hypothetical protein